MKKFIPIILVSFMIINHINKEKITNFTNYTHEEKYPDYNKDYQINITSNIYDKKKRKK